MFLAIENLCNVTYFLYTLIYNILSLRIATLSTV